MTRRNLLHAATSSLTSDVVGPAPDWSRYVGNVQHWIERGGPAEGSDLLRSQVAQLKLSLAAARKVSA
jgi:hypothetical protein